MYFRSELMRVNQQLLLWCPERPILPLPLSRGWTICDLKTPEITVRNIGKLAARTPASAAAILSLRISRLAVRKRIIYARTFLFNFDRSYYIVDQ